MVYDLNKKNDSAAKKTTQGSAGSVPEINTSVASMPEATDAPAETSYVPGSNTDSAKAGLADVQNESKINGLADAAENYVPQPTNINYAAEMQKLLALPQTPENQQKMGELIRGRNLKISLNPETYGQYRDDAYAQAADDYLSYIIPERVNTQKYLDSMYANTDNRYQAQLDLLQKQLEGQNKMVSEKYKNLRNTAMINAARHSIGNEEMLAAQGLGRGVSNPASSGFGESSRIMAQTSLNNNLSDAYLAEQKALEDLRSQYNQNQLQAYMDYADRANSIDVQALNQANQDRNYNYNIQNANIQNRLNSDMFDWQRDTDARDFGRNIFESDRNFAEGVRQFDAAQKQNAQQFAASNELDWYLAKNKGSRGGSVYDDGYIFDNGGTPYAQPTMTDAEASDYVRQALQEGGKNNAIYTLAYLSNTGQISKIMEQILIDELGLTENEGWLK